MNEQQKKKKKEKHARQAEQVIIRDLFDEVQRGLYALHGEIGGITPTVTKHDGYTYSITVRDGRRVRINVEVES
jgi:hypothetical protein